MNVQSISLQDLHSQKPMFKASYVTLSEKNLGQKISQEVVGNFNEKILPNLRKTSLVEAIAILISSGWGEVINEPEDYSENVNFFSLAAGSGSRFKELAQAIGDYNKVSLPFKIGKEKEIHLLDFAMAMGKYFTGEEGVKTIISPQPTGSFGDIVAHYQKNPIKDTVVCCGDNVFGDRTTDIMTFFVKEINNPDKHVALVGVKRTPEEVANRFGVLQVESVPGEETFKLKGCSEKPELDEAQALAVDGQNIANTGLFYISKEAMEKLMAEINSGVNNIKKNDTELYDFANAIEYVHSMLPQWFGIKSDEGADVKVVNKWEDVGDPKALYRFADDVKNGLYLNNFPQPLADRIQWSFAHRVHLHPESEYSYINFSPSLQITTKQLIEAKNIDGVNIIV